MPDSSFQETVALVREAAGGRAEARERLFDRYLPRLRQLVALRLGRRLGAFAEVDDLVQETLLLAHERLESFEMRSEGAFLDWLGEIARNRLGDLERRREARKRGEGRVRPFAAYDSSVLSSSILPGAGPSPSQAAAARELESLLETAMLALPERQRRVIDMRRICGMEYEEIAASLGMESPSSARSLYSRALAELSGRFPAEIRGRLGSDRS